MNIFIGRIHKKNREEIEDYIEDGEYEIAEKILENYTPGEEISEKDAVTLKVSLDRARLLAEFQQAFDRDDLVKAKEVFSRMKEKIPHSASDIMGIEAKLDSYSEDSLLDKMEGLHGMVRIRAAEKYLGIYENGVHRERVVKDILITNLGLFLDYTKTRDPAEVCKQLSKFNEACTRFKDDKIQLPSLSLDDIMKKTREYYDLISEPYEPGEVNEIGRQVMTVYQAEPGYRASYIKERAERFPFGLKGTVVNFSEENNDVAVKFHGVEIGPWPTGWQGYLSDCQAKGVYNVAEYKISELVPVVKADEEIKLLFENEMQNLQDNLTYLTRTD